ncbi:hypothetical protein, partial [Cobetia amphilecti]|uniref:hypothetical protein n=1 Tax=Cobetia amphilecti TaxID=1055104 RepID=UPI001C092655
SESAAKLFLIVCMAFILAVVVECHIPVYPPFRQTVFEGLLTNNALKRMISGVSMGLTAAYLFYIVVDYLPRARREKVVDLLLSRVLASIIDSYTRCRLFGHATALNGVNIDCVKLESLEGILQKLKSYKAPALGAKKQQIEFHKLKYAVETAHARVDDFNHSLQLAASLSPQHALQWLIICDKVRYMARLYDEWPDIAENQYQYLGSSSQYNLLASHEESMRSGFMELIEQAIAWRR